jgi:hypothetical protein
VGQVLIDDSDKPALCPCKGLGALIGKIVVTDRVVERFQCQRCDRLFTRTVRDADDVAEDAPGKTNWA